MSLERVFKALLSLGLSEPDARVYIFLALKGPKKPRKIVNNLEMSKQQIFRSLRNLRDKGIIILDLKSKNSFSALPFEEGLKLLINTGKKQTEMIQENLLLNWKAMMKKKPTNS